MNELSKWRSRMDPRPPFRALKPEALAAMEQQIPTPAYVLDEGQLRRNGEILASVAERTGAKILLAQKAFSNYDLYPVLAPYLAGTEASGLYEARLGAEMMPGKEVHVFCGAYRDEEFEELLKWADHIVFNSPRQLQKFGARAKAAGKSVGLRINPECSTQEGHAIYDPCAPGSRLGTTRAQWDSLMDAQMIDLLDGLHFHTLCEQDSDALEMTLPAVEAKFGDVLPKLKWVNFGGGHHITRTDYDIERLENCIVRIRDRYHVEVYLEPGEACALNAGYLLSRVLDLPVNGETKLAILDMSAACHTPDVLEMPYRPPVFGARDPEESTQEGSTQEGSTQEGSIQEENTREESTQAESIQEEITQEYIYRLAGPTCLAGDVVGDYAFADPLQEGDLLIFGDMAIYTTCKNNTFNGMPLPSIWVRRESGKLEELVSFGYEDFKMRLGKH